MTFSMKKHKQSIQSRPHRPDSIWNQPIPAGVSTTALTNNTGALWLDFWNTPVGSPSKPGISIPIYYAAPSDPLVSVYYAFNNFAHTNGGGYPRWTVTSPQQTQIKSEWLASFNYAGQATPFMKKYSSTTLNSSGTLWTAPANYRHLSDAASPPVQIRVPGGFAYPAAGTDGHIIVVQPDGTVFEGIQCIWLLTGELTVYDYCIYDPSDYGDGFTHGACASMIPAMTGMITQHDADLDRIDHALALTRPPTCLSNASILYPAYAMDKDGAVSGGTLYSGSEPMGSRIIIPAATNIAGHTWTSNIGLIVATAFQTYGGFIVDRGGTTGLQIKIQANMTTNKWNTWTSAEEADLTFILNNWLVRVTTAYTAPSGR